MNLSDSLGIDGIRVAGQLVNLLLVLILQLAHKVVGFDATRPKLLSDIEITTCSCTLALQLTELNALIGLRYCH